MNIYLKMEMLKEQNIGHRILFFRFYKSNDMIFFFRNLTDEEYLNVYKIANSNEEIEDYICQLCLLEPKQFNFNDSDFAGFSEKISKKIIEQSILKNNEIKNEYVTQRSDMNDFKNQCIAIIKSQFKEFSFEELETWPISRILKYVSRAEFIYNLTHKDNPMELNLTSEDENDVEEEVIEISLTEKHNKMIGLGLDPVMEESKTIKYQEKELRGSIITGGRYWNNEVIVNELRINLENNSTKTSRK